MNNSEKIAEILQKIENLSTKLTQIQGEINALKVSALILREQSPSPQPQLLKAENAVLPTVEAESPLPVSTKIPEYSTVVPKNKKIIREAIPAPPQYAWLEMEKFIGENLSNKIGILVMVLGIAIGVKYAIDKELISPLMRIILGYLVSFSLVGVSIKLREKYIDLSAVILSGALASLYFVTFIAYDFYNLMPQILTFLMMLVITTFAVAAALSYNLQVIAIGGLVGAYFIPFLLSNNSNRADILFSYLLFINIGIMYIAFKKDWKLTNYLAFLITWVIYVGWLISNYRNELYEHFLVAFIFVILFFALFYTTFLAYKFINNKPFTATSVSMLLMNTSVFYGIGYVLLLLDSIGKDYLGFFTLCNAIIHFGVSMAIYRRELADKNLFFLVSGLVLTFITLTIPAQFSGHWILKFWAFEMALLFWIGRTKQVKVYEKLAYPLIFLNIVGFINHIDNYNYNTTQNPILSFWNEYFLTTVILGVMFYLMHIINKNEKYELPKNNTIFSRNTLSTLFAATLFAIIYVGFYLEINNYFANLYNKSFVTITIGLDTYNRPDDIIYNLRDIWVLYYSLFFIIGLFIFNIRKPQNKHLAQVSLISGLLVLFLFLTLGLYTLGHLKNSYLNPPTPQYFSRSIGLLYLRYIGFALIASLFYVGLKNIKLFFQEQKDLSIIVEIILYITILWCISSEMVNWLEIMRYNAVYKTVLSILFGVYALFLIIFGIKKEKQHLRILGMSLFGITLVKLFFYDLANLETISKTIIMIVLGGLLLIVSFVYNKIKNDNNKNSNENNHL